MSRFRASPSLARRFAGASLLLLVIALSACSTSSIAASQQERRAATTSGVDLTTDASSYRAGYPVFLELRNNSSEDVGGNLCTAFLSLERRVNDSWEQVKTGLARPQDTPAVCTTELRILKPGTAATQTAFLPEETTPGTYRITNRLYIGSESETVATQAFTVNR